MPTRRSRRAGKIFPSMPLPCAAASGESRTEADRTLLKPLFDFLRSLGAARIAAMGAVSLGLIGFLAWFVMRLSTSPLVPLYTDLTFEDSNAIISELDSRAIDYELRQDGAVVLVPSDHDVCFHDLRTIEGFADRHNRRRCIYVDGHRRTPNVGCVVSRHRHQLVAAIDQRQPARTGHC